MGKQLKWTPPSDAIPVEETTEQKPWTPPTDAVPVDEPVKKKESTLTSSSDSPEPVLPLKSSSEKSTTTNNYEAIGQALDQISPLAKPIYDFGRRVISGFTDDIPKSVAQGLEVAKSSVAPATIKEYIKSDAYADFQKYVRKKENLKWYEPFDEDKYIDQYSDSFMKDTGQQELADKINARNPEIIKRRQEVEKFVQEQNLDAQQKMKGAVQDYRDIKDLRGVASYIATMGGQAAYQIPLAILTKGQSSLLQESAAVYDIQLDNLAKDNGMSREEVIDKGLDKPAEGQAYALLAASLDAASAGNILKAFKAGAKDGLLKRWAKTAIPEAITEPVQGVLENVGGATGDKLDAAQEAITDPDRINEMLGGLIGGSAGAIASPTETVRKETAAVIPNNEVSIDNKANAIQESVEANEENIVSGQPEITAKTPTQNDQTPQGAPVASTEGTEDTAVPENIQEEEIQTQGEPEVKEEPVTETEPTTLATPEEETTAPPIDKAAAKQAIEQLITDGDLKREDDGRVTVLTERGGSELKRILDENQIKYNTKQPRDDTNETGIQSERSGGINTDQELTDTEAVGEQPVPDVLLPTTEQQSKPDAVITSTEQRSENSEPDVVADQPIMAQTKKQDTPKLSAEQSATSAQERKTWLAIKDNPDISDEVKSGISTEGKEYVPRSLKKVTEKEADAIIESKGLDSSTKMYLDDESGMTPDVDTAIGIKLFDKLQKAENYTDAVRVFEKLAVRGTELGQAINAFKLLRGKTMAHVVDKSIKKARKKFKENNAGIGKKAKKSIDKINQDAVEKVLRSPSVKAKITSQVKQGKIKQAIDFLETLKIDTSGKALDVTFGITAAAWNTVITAVQKGLQAGLTISQAINKAVAKVKDPAFQKQDAVTFLDEKLKDYRVSLDPGRAIKEELRSSGEKIDDIIRQHYSQQASTKASLIEKLIKDGNVPADQAQAISDELGKEFDRLTREAKEKSLKRLLPKESKKRTPKERKDTIDELIEQSNMGALSDEQYNEVIADKLGVPKLNEQQLKEIQDLTDRIQTSKGDSQQSKAAQDLMNYVENLKGWSWADAVQAVWYANILSGPTTWLVTNPFANLTNLVAEAMIDISQNPTKGAFILGRIASGLTKGMIYAGDVLKTGYSPYKGEDYKTESKPLLERIEFKGGAINPLNWLKYVTRAIKAGDILFYHGLKEQRIAVMALNEARKHGRTTPNGQDMKALYNALMKENFDDAMAQAESEGFKGREQKIRAYEILEKTRPEAAIKESENFASRGTFNIKPEGSLGQLADIMNSARRKLPVINYVMPFVNTIMNVANEYLNYTPVVGGIRAYKGSLGWNPDSKTYRKLSNEERARIAIKAMIGTIAMTALAMLDDPDDEDNFIEITANGYGDMRKNYELERTGWRPYSIRVGDKWMSYKNTPLAMPMASIGYFKDSQRYKKETNTSQGLMIMGMGSFNFLMDLSALSGLSDLIKILTTETLSEQGSNAEKLLKTIEKTAKSVVVPNYFTQISRLVQELTESPIKRADEIGQTVIRDVPVLRDNLGNLYDAFGDPVIPKQMEKLIPLNMHRTPEDAELFDFLKENKLLVGVPAKSNLKPNGEPMTEEEYREFALQSARQIKDRLKREYRIYERSDNKEEIKDWFDDVKTEERRQAKQDLFGFF